MDISLIHDLIVVALAIMGVCLTLLPPKNLTWKIIFIVGFGLLAVSGVVVSHLERKKANADHQSELANQQNKLNELQRSNERLEKSTQRQEQMLAPILALAKEKYPDLPPSEALEKLEKEIQNLETRTSSLEQKTADRQLTEDMKTYLISALKDYKGTNIKIIPSPSIEATSFASQIVDVLKEAGWEVSDTIGKIEGDTAVIQFSRNELYVLGDPGAKIGGPPFYLIKALKCIGVHVVLYDDKALKPGYLKLFIGEKLKDDKLAFDQGESCKLTK